MSRDEWSTAAKRVKVRFIDWKIFLSSKQIDNNYFTQRNEGKCYKMIFLLKFGNIFITRGEGNNQTTRQWDYRMMKMRRIILNTGGDSEKQRNWIRKRKLKKIVAKRRAIMRKIPTFSINRTPFLFIFVQRTKWISVSGEKHHEKRNSIFIFHYSNFPTFLELIVNFSKCLSLFLICTRISTATFYQFYASAKWNSSSKFP